MARTHARPPNTGFSLILADDDPDYLGATQLLLQSEGHKVLVASNGQEALRLVRENDADLLLLDYFMPDLTAEEVVAELRRFGSPIQVVLQTGYADERPPREMLRRLDIQGYHDKSEGPEKLLLWTDAALKAAQALRRLDRSRRGLRAILDGTSTLHRVRPLTDVFRDVLQQGAALIGAGSCFLAVLSEGGVVHTEEASPDGFLALIAEESGLTIQAGLGRFASGPKLDECLSRERYDQVIDTLRRGELLVADGATIVPLTVGDVTLGVLYLDRPTRSQVDTELLRVFANQATVAIQNMQLYEMAAMDPLTGVHARRFFENWLRREVRIAFRSRRPVSAVMIDMDGLKNINDTLGHLAGDRALAAVGKVLRDASREHDVVGRYGGDEFMMVLPQTGARGAERMGRRVLSLLKDIVVSEGGERIAVRASLGVSVLLAHELEGGEISRPVPVAYFQNIAQTLVLKADEALYRAKAAGGACLHVGEPTRWHSLSS
jgi:two-component system, cell cycle response regulator